MDRFIVPMICEKINPFHNLKSNMDRFIDPKTKQHEFQYMNLKSNMDRFIDILGFTNDPSTHI